MNTQKEIYLSEDASKLIIKETGIELKKDNKTIGERAVTDTYKVSEMKHIVDFLKEEIDKLTKMSDQSSKTIDDLQKKFDKREENKIKDFKAMFGKLDAYNKAQDEKTKLQNVTQAIERDRKDLGEVVAILNEVEDPKPDPI